MATSSYDDDLAREPEFIPVRSTIGGSSAAAACGLDPYRSRPQLWLEMTGRIEPEPAGEAAEWGTRLQPLIALAVEEWHGYSIMPAPSEALVHPEHEWMTAHLDGYAGSASDERGVAEFKTASLRFSQLWREGAAPIHYEIQCAHYLAVTGLSWALLAVLIGGQRLEVRRIERVARLEELMIEQESEFLGYVERDEPPPVDGSKGASRMLEILYPGSDDAEPVVLTDREAAWVAEYSSLRSAVKSTEERIALIAQQLQEYLGDASVGMLDGSPVVRWTRVQPKARKISASEAKRMAEEYPEMFAEFSYTPDAYRRFTVK